MKKGSIYSLMAGVIALIMSACAAKIQTYDLSEEYATSLHIQPVEGEGGGDGEQEPEGDGLAGVPVANYYGGDLKRGGVWWASKGVSLEKGDIFIFNVTHIGADSTPQGATNPAIDLPTTPFGATFPPIDLVKEPSFLKISARAQGKDGAEPILYLQIDDANGLQANAKRPAHKILNSADFMDYYFDIRDIWYQLEPKKKVNGAFVNSIKFFISPGYNGDIFIREIKVVPAKSVEVK